MRPASAFIREGWEEGLFRGLCLLPLTLYAFSVLGFVLGFSLSPSHLWLGILTFAGLNFSLLRKQPKLALITSAASGLWMLTCAWFVGHLVDFSYDGTQYHQEAILQLRLGWNPFRSVITPDVWDTSWAVWLNSLPKFGWTVEAMVATSFHSLEAAKFLPLYGLPLIALSAYLCATKAFGLSPRVSGLVGWVAMLSPITASQLVINYSDGYVSNFACVLVFRVVDYLKRGNSESRKDLVLALVLAGLVKFTNLFPILTMGLVLLGWEWFRSGAKKTVQFFATLTGLALLTAATLGFNPYVSNLIRYGALNYPMSGAQWIHGDHIGRARLIEEGVEEPIYSAHLPANFVGHNRVYKFFYSLFSRSEHVAVNIGTGAHLKLPFTVNQKEWVYVGTSDGRIAGLGPLFSGVFLLSLLALLLARRKEPSLLAIAAALAVAAMMNPYGWWTRYIGFFWEVAALGLIAAAVNPVLSLKHKRIAIALIVFFATANSLPIFYSQLSHSVQYTRNTKHDFQKQLADQGYVVLDAHHAGIRGFLNEQGFPFLPREVEVRMVNAHYLSPSEPCSAQWESWFTRPAKGTPEDEEKRSRGFLNAQGKYQLRAGLSKESTLSAAQCYSKLSMRPFQTIPLFSE